MSDPLDNPFGGKGVGGLRNNAKFMERARPGLKLAGIFFGLTAVYLVTGTAYKSYFRYNTTSQARRSKMFSDSGTLTGVSNKGGNGDP